MRSTSAPGRLRQGDAVGEARIAEAHVVIERVVVRVVDAVLLLLAAVADVERGDAEVLQERRVVRARAERADREVVAGGRASRASSLSSLRRALCDALRPS